MKYLVSTLVFIFGVIAGIRAQPTITSHPSGTTFCWSISESPTHILSVSASGQEPLSYQWYKDGIPIAAGGQSSTYTVTLSQIDDESTFYCRVTDGNSDYANSNSATVYERMNPEKPDRMNVFPLTTNCPGGSFKLEAEGMDTPDAEWTFYAGSCGGGSAIGTGREITVSPASTTTYYVREEGDCGVSLCESGTVTIYTLSTAPSGVSSTQSTICAGDQTTLSVTGGSLGSLAHWEWFTGGCGTTFIGSGASIDVSPASSTTYYVRAKGACNTTSCKSAAVTVKALPSAPAGSDKTICESGDASLTASGTDLKWYSDAGLGEQVGSGSPYNTGIEDAGSYTFYVTQTSNGCEGPAKAVQLKVNPNADPDVLEDQVLCDDELGVFQIGSTSLDGHSYDWSSQPPGFTSSEANPSVAPDTSVVFFLRETIDSSGCFADDSVSFTIHPTPVPEIGRDTGICRNSVIPFRIGSAGKTGHAYAWASRPPGFSSAEADPLVAPGATTTYILTESILATGCSAKDSLRVDIYPVPVPQTAGDTTLCSGDLLPFRIGSEALPGHSYLWVSEPAGFTSTSPNPLVNPDQTIRYYLLETIDSTSCATEDTVLVTIHPTPEVEVNYTEYYMNAGEQVTLTASGTEQYEWFPGTWLSDTTGPSITASPLENIEYMVCGSNSFGCTDRDTVALYVYCRACSDTVFIQPSGYFNHGCRNNNYNDDAACSWTILPSGVSRIYLSFRPDSFDIGAGDWLYVYDGQDATAELIGKYNNDDPPPPEITGGNSLYIRFVSDGSVTGAGFQARWADEPVTESTSPAVYGPRIYPNPAGSILTLEFHSGIVGTADIRIFNGTGRLVYMHRFAVEPGWIREVIDTGEFKAGMYLIRVHNREQVISGKFIRE